MLPQVPLNEIRKLFRDIVNINKEINKKINLNYILFINKIKNNIINILEHLHNRGYAHTDIKPENILVDIPRLESTIIYERIKTGQFNFFVFVFAQIFFEFVDCLFGPFIITFIISKNGPAIASM